MRRSGSFSGLVYHEWLDDKNKIKTLATLTYFDRKGRAWTVPKGTVVDRRSEIPRCLRRWVADPFCAKMRRSTVVHSHFSKTRVFPSAAVHRMYFEAMKTDGVPRRQRIAVYWWLILFGPKWGRGT